MSYTLKQKILNALESNELDSIPLLAKDDRKVLSQLVRITYDKDTLVGWRAITAIGLAAQVLVKTDHAFLRETIRKLLWSLSDESGGIGWSAPEILGEIVSADPEKFRDIIPLIAEVYDIEEKVFRPGVIYALNRIAASDTAFVMPHKDIVIRSLSDNNPLVRTYALELVQVLKSHWSKEEKDAINELIQKLSSDHAEVWMYKNEGFQNIQVREEALPIT